MALYRRLCMIRIYWLLLLFSYAKYVCFGGLCEQQAQSAFQLTPLDDADSKHDCYEMCCRLQDCHLSLYNADAGRCFGVTCHEKSLCNAVAEQLENFKGHRVDKRSTLEDDDSLTLSNMFLNQSSVSREKRYSHDDEDDNDDNEDNDDSNENDDQDKKDSSTEMHEDIMKHNKKCAKPVFHHSNIPKRHKSYEFKQLHGKVKKLADCSRKCCKTDDCVLGFSVGRACFGVICADDSNNCHSKRDKLPRMQLLLSLVKPKQDDNEAPSHKIKKERKKKKYKKEKKHHKKSHLKSKTMDRPTEPIVQPLDGESIGNFDELHNTPSVNEIEHSPLEESTPIDITRPTDAARYRKKEHYDELQDDIKMLNFAKGNFDTMQLSDDRMASFANNVEDEEPQIFPPPPPPPLPPPRPAPPLDDEYVKLPAQFHNNGYFAKADEESRREDFRDESDRDTKHQIDHNTDYEDEYDEVKRIHSPTRHKNLPSAHVVYGEDDQPAHRSLTTVHHSTARHHSTTGGHHHHTTKTHHQTTKEHHHTSSKRHHQTSKHKVPKESPHLEEDGIESSGEASGSHPAKKKSSKKDNPTHSVKEDLILSKIANLEKKLEQKLKGNDTQVAEKKNTVKNGESVDKKKSEKKQHENTSEIETEKSVNKSKESDSMKEKNTNSDDGNKRDSKKHSDKKIVSKANKKKKAHTSSAKKSEKSKDLVEGSGEEEHNKTTIIEQNLDHLELPSETKNEKPEGFDFAPKSKENSEQDHGSGSGQEEKDEKNGSRKKDKQSVKGTKKEEVNRKLETSAQPKNVSSSEHAHTKKRGRVKKVEHQPKVVHEDDDEEGSGPPKDIMEMHHEASGELPKSEKGDLKSHTEKSTAKSDYTGKIHAKEGATKTDSSGKSDTEKEASKMAKNAEEEVNKAKHTEKSHNKKDAPKSDDTSNSHSENDATKKSHHKDSPIMETTNNVTIARNDTFSFKRHEIPNSKKHHKSKKKKDKVPNSSDHSRKKEDIFKEFEKLREMYKHGANMKFHRKELKKLEAELVGDDDSSGDGKLPTQKQHVGKKKTTVATTTAKPVKTTPKTTTTITRKPTKRTPPKTTPRPPTVTTTKRRTTTKKPTTTTTKRPTINTTKKKPKPTSKATQTKVGNLLPHDKTIKHKPVIVKPDGKSLVNNHKPTESSKPTTKPKTVPTVAVDPVHTKPGHLKSEAVQSTPKIPTLNIAVGDEPEGPAIDISPKEKSGNKKAPATKLGLFPIQKAKAEIHKTGNNKHVLPTKPVVKTKPKHTEPKHKPTVKLHPTTKTVHKTTKPHKPTTKVKHMPTLKHPTKKVKALPTSKNKHFANKVMVKHPTSKIKPNTKKPDLKKAQPTQKPALKKAQPTKSHPHKPPHRATTRKPHPTMHKQPTVKHHKPTTMKHRQPTKRPSVKKPHKTTRFTTIVPPATKKPKPTTKRKHTPTQPYRLVQATQDNSGSTPFNQVTTPQPSSGPFSFDGNGILNHKNAQNPLNNIFNDLKGAQPTAGVDPNNLIFPTPPNTSPLNVHPPENDGMPDAVGRPILDGFAKPPPMKIQPPTTPLPHQTQPKALHKTPQFPVHAAISPPKQQKPVVAGTNAGKVLQKPPNIVAHNPVGKLPPKPQPKQVSKPQISPPVKNAVKPKQPTVKPHNAHNPTTKIAKPTARKVTKPHSTTKKVSTAARKTRKTTQTTAPPQKKESPMDVLKRIFGDQKSNKPSDLDDFFNSKKADTTPKPQLAKLPPKSTDNKPGLNSNLKKSPSKLENFFKKTEIKDKPPSHVLHPNKTMPEKETPITPINGCKIAKDLRNTMFKDSKVGNVQVDPHSKTLNQCVNQCCRHDNCHVAMYENDVCRLVECSDHLLCHSLSSTPRNVRLVFMSKQPSALTATRYCDQQQSLSVQWQRTQAGNAALRNCPRDALGKAKRRCDEHGHWQPPDFSSCSSVDYINLQQQIKGLGYTTSVRALVRQMNDVTTQSIDNSIIFGGDLKKVSDTVEGIASFLTRTKAENFNHEDLKRFATSVSNMLDETNKQEWANIQQDVHGPTKLINSLDDVGLYAADKMITAHVMNPVLTRSILMTVAKQHGSHDYTFPNYTIGAVKNWVNRKDWIKIPRTILSKGGETSLVTSATYKTLGFLLPHRWNTKKHVTFTDGFVINSNVISCSVSPKPTMPIRPPVVIVLHHLKQMPASESKCVFWDINSKNGMGSWSTEGCVMISNNKTTSVCSCNHLTHFALLTHIGDQKVEAKQQTKEHTMAAIWLAIPLSLVTLLAALYTCFAWSKAPRRRHVVIMDKKPSLPNDEEVVTKTVVEKYPGSPDRFLYAANVTPSPSDLEWEHAWDYITNSDCDSESKKLLHQHFKRERQRIQRMRALNTESSSLTSSQGSFKWKHDFEWSTETLRCLGKKLHQPLMTSSVESTTSFEKSHFDTFSPVAISSPQSISFEEMHRKKHNYLQISFDPDDKPDESSNNHLDDTLSSWEFEEEFYDSLEELLTVPSEDMTLQKPPEYASLHERHSIPEIVIEFVRDVHLLNVRSAHEELGQVCREGCCLLYLERLMTCEEQYCWDSCSEISSSYSSLGSPSTRYARLDAFYSLARRSSARAFQRVSRSLPSSPAKKLQKETGKDPKQSLVRTQAMHMKSYIALRQQCRVNEVTKVEHFSPIKRDSPIAKAPTRLSNMRKDSQILLKDNNLHDQNKTPQRAHHHQAPKRKSALVSLKQQYRCIVALKNSPESPKHAQYITDSLKSAEKPCAVVKSKHRLQRSVRLALYRQTEDAWKKSHLKNSEEKVENRVYLSLNR